MISQAACRHIEGGVLYRRRVQTATIKTQWHFNVWRHRALLRFFLRFFRYTAFSLMAAVIVVAGTYIYVRNDLPSVDVLKNINLQTPLRVYAADGSLLGLFGEQRRIPLRMEDMPGHLVDAFIAAEDARFQEHSGIDYMGLMRAAYMLLKTGEKRHGGSTITMQLARNFFLSNERTYERKLKEIILALIIEHKFSKDEILALYLNKIFFGHQAYGVGAAAEVYYGKTIDRLTLDEVAMIAGLPKAPSRYNPITNSARALERRNYVLDQMLRLNMITQPEHAVARSAADKAMWHRPQLQLEAPYVAEMVRAELFERYGPGIYTDGYEAMTTIDPGLQEAANAVLRAQLLKYDRRHGYRGAEASMEGGASLDDFSLIGDLWPAQVVALNGKEAHLYLSDGTRVVIGKPGYLWARPYISEDARGNWPLMAADVFQVGDIVRVTLDESGEWVLAQLPDVEGAFVSLKARSGDIAALVGGFDFKRSKFNRVVQAERQPGSSFKPFIYSAALEHGYTPSSIVNDAPIIFSDGSSAEAWRPSNYGRKFHGPTRLRKALAHSRNLASINLADAIGLRRVLEHIMKFGFRRENHPYNLTMALGSGTVTPYELVKAYAAFANGGFLIEPRLITRVRRNGEIVYRSDTSEVCSACDIEHTAPFAEETIRTVSEAEADTATGVEGGGNVEGNDSGDKASTTPTPSVDVAISATEASAVAGDTGESTLPPRIIDADVAYQMVGMLKDVIRYGTGRKARALKRTDIAGKTGTTNEQYDAWFAGFSPDIVSVSWVGFDDHRPLGRRETGGVAALPMWMDFMRAVSDKYPPVKAGDANDYYRSPNIVDARIDPETGLLAHPQMHDALLETFRSEHLPAKFAPPADTPSVDDKRKELF